MRLLTVVLTLLCGVTRGMAQTTSQSTTPETLPAVTVTEINVPNEEALMGPNQQPEWTTRRRFARTRIYVMPPWQVETEFGWRTTYPRTGKPTHKLTQEIELGLPHRFQVDYQAAETIANDVWDYDSSAFELRWALANWGVIPLNPTVKAEWKINDAAADAYGLTVSLGDEIAPRWHWGAELFYEQQVGDNRETQYAISQAVSYTVIDEKLGVGIEMKLADDTDNGDRNPHWSLLIGPSVQWRPTRHTHLDIVPLFGLTGGSPRVQSFIFFGIDFGPGSERAEGVTPASLRGR